MLLDIIMNYPERKEIVLGDVPEINIPEIKVSYSRDGRPFLGKILNVQDVADFIRSTFDTDTLELQEQFIVLYLSRGNEIIGYYRHSKVAIHAVAVDIRIVLGAVLKCGCVSMIVAHNHPSGTARPSESDRKLTIQLKKATAINDIDLIDHFVITKNSYYSFAQHQELELAGVQSLVNRSEQFVSKVFADLQNKIPHNKKSIEKLAATYQIKDKTEVKELTELAIVLKARKLAHTPGSVRERFDRIVDLYNSQVNLSHRTSQSILLQQYSTPAPIAYLAGVFCGIDKLTRNQKALEPSAGNGMLTIAGSPEIFEVNEIDTFRNGNLEKQGFFHVGKQDATKIKCRPVFDAVLTNPPFGISEEVVMFDTFRIVSLEHVMALRALECMKDDGKAAIIIGGHTRWDDKGRIQAGKQRIFFNYLYSRYNVTEVINIDGHKLYSRQGTSFDVRLILINGRKQTPSGNAPVFDQYKDVEIKTFNDLFERVMDAIEIRNTNPQENSMRFLELEAEALQLELDLLHAELGAIIPGNINKSIYKSYLIVREKYASISKLIVLIKNGKGEHITFDMDAERLAYMFSLPLTHFALIGGKKVYGVNINERKFFEIRSQLTEAGYELLAIPSDYDFSGIDEEQDDDSEDYDRLFIRYGELQPAYPGVLILLETSGSFVTFNEDAVTLAKTLKLSHINIKGPKYEYIISGISKILMDEYLERLRKAGVVFSIIPNGKATNWKKLNEEALRFLRWRNEDDTDELGAPYEPSSNACIKLDTQVPDSMAFETHTAIRQIKVDVGGDIDNFVRDRLKYPTKAALCKVLSAEQIDAVATAIYNIEAREQGMIIGDQTGIGKGRVAAAMIRYGVVQGMKPIFLTEKANLFSDIYRDLNAIGSGHLKPFIVNNRESKTDIKDEDGNIIYQAPPPPEQQSIIQSREIPAKYDFVIATYSQFNSAEKKPEKPHFLKEVASDNLLIMDEAHNSSGSSNTGFFMQGVVRLTKGVVFLSATFAKRPDNFPIYAMKTSIADCNMSKEDMIDAIYRGGVALQEVLSSQLVSEGQMLRRERSFEGVEVNYINLDEKAEEHKAISDNITSILRDIIAFQGKYIDKEIDELDKIAVAEGKEVQVREGTSQAGVDNLPYFSKVFQVINQMLFSLKAEAVTERTIERLREGKKPVIAFASTMGAFIEAMENEQGLPVSDGDTINADFAEVLKRGLDGILRYTVKDIDGNPKFEKFSVDSLSAEAQMEYHRILDKIKTASTGISISPIDVIIQKIKAAGYKVAEVTGRKYEVQLNLTTGKGLVLARKRINTNDAFRQFNNNEVDVLMINQSGSTGASAHAIPTAKIPKEQVRQRVMVVLQAELDISTEVQKRGRINRTGQILKPIYDYLTSSIPAEKRLMMMLQKKLKSLDANTTSNQKQSTKILDVPDFLNKYGDKIVKEYLMDYPEVNKLLDDPLNLEESGSDSSASRNITIEDAAMKVSGRVAVLSTKMQEDFYNEIAERYTDYVEYLKQVGEYDLEVEDMKLDAETVSAKAVIMGKGGGSVFGNDSILETVRANVLKKPFSRAELENILKESLTGKDPQDQQQELLEEYGTEVERRLAQIEQETNERYDELISDIPNEKSIKKLAGNPAAYNEAIKEREKELNEAREIQLRNTEKTSTNRRQYLEKALRFFYVGRLLSFPVETYSNGKELVPGVFLGFVIDRKKKNPYAASAIKVRFAIANSSKYMAIPASYSEQIMEVIGASVDLDQPSTEQLLSDWEGYIKQNNVDRRIRHIVTGNLLQASSEMKGKLVSYTTIDGEIKKGILMPENWNPGEQVQDKVVVPILKALPLIKSITQNGHIPTDNGISFFRAGDHYKVVVAASRSRGGDIYLDKELLELVDKNNFEKVSDKMVAMLSPQNIARFVEVLQINHGTSVTIHSSQTKYLNNSAAYNTRKKIELPGPEEPESEKKQEATVISMLELEAEALILELELLAA